MTIGQLVVGAIGVWSASFFVRYHHMAIREVGTVLGPVVGVSGTIGVLLGGVLADRAAHNDPSRALWVVIASLALITPAEGAVSPTATRLQAGAMSPNPTGFYPTTDCQAASAAARGTASV
jgi:hypothetical protein